MSIEKYSPDKYPVDSTLASLIPSELSVKNRLVPLMQRGHLLKVAMIDPLDIGATEDIEIYKNCEVEPVICTERELAQLTGVVYGMSAGIEGVLESIESMSLDPEAAPAADIEDMQVSSLEDMAGEAPVIRLVNSLLSQAVREGASDVHISPERESVTIRFRLDGKLKPVPSPPKP
jgi:type IV pilus assembly protein PilB